MVGERAQGGGEARRVGGVVGGGARTSRGGGVAGARAVPRVVGVVPELGTRLTHGF